MKKINLRSKINLVILLIIVLLVFIISRFVNLSIKNENISKEQWREDINSI